MGVVTDLGFEDIGSRLVYNEQEARWDVLNKYSIIRVKRRSPI